MRWLPLLLLVLNCCLVTAQTIHGQLRDKDTQEPLPYIFVSCASGSTMTDEEGRFSLKIVARHDTVRIKNMLYRDYSCPVVEWGTMTRTILLEHKIKALREVRITAKRDHYNDSISLRSEFAREFNYSGPRLKEILRPSSTNAPFSFATVDLLSLYGLMTKNKSQRSRLQRQLLADEKARHVDQRFNKTMISRITHLSGDSLETFLSTYRPSAAQLDRLTDYELIFYIKNNVERYRTGKDDTVRSIFNTQ